MTEPGADYDHIVVGAGLGGLAAAAYLARSGDSVLLLEKSDEPGGLARTFRRDGYAITHCPFLLFGAYPGGWTRALLEELDCWEALDLRALDPLSAVYLPSGEIVVVPPDGKVVEVLCSRHPEHADGIAAFYAECDRLVEVWGTPEVTADDDYPLLGDDADLASVTLAQLMDRYLPQDDELRTLVASAWAHWGLPISRASGLRAAAMIGLAQRGLYTMAGGPSPLAEALLADAVAHGATVRLNTRVTRIDVDETGARGVTWSGGQARSRSVIANAPAPETLFELVGRRWLTPDYGRAIVLGTPSMSAFQVFLGTDLDLTTLPHLAAENTVLGGVDQDDLFNRALRGDQRASFTVFATSLVDENAAPAGLSAVKIMGPGPLRRRGFDWDRDGEALVDDLVAAAERVIPGLREHVRWRAWSPPTDLVKISGSASGAIYGWDSSPAHSGPHRLPRRTCVPGLWLASAWTGLGGGMDLTLLAGRATAQAVLRERRDPTAAEG